MAEAHPQEEAAQLDHHHRLRSAEAKPARLGRRCNKALWGGIRVRQLDDVEHSREATH